MTAELMLKTADCPVSSGEEDVSQFLREIREYPRLSPQEERELAMRCAEGDEDAIRSLIDEANRIRRIIR